MNRVLPLLLMLGACAGHSSSHVRTPPVEDDPPVGLLVMAHGGSAAWNQTVADAVAPLRRKMPTAVAYGMADPESLEAGLDSLRSRGVGRAAVVRVFVSGESFLEQTEYLLGISELRPADLLLMGRDPATVGPIDHGLEVATHRDGLMDSHHAGRILVDRVLDESAHRHRESVLLLAHGMGDDEQNERVLEAMGRVAVDLESRGFASASSATLREDWAGKRELAEAEIRDYVAGEAASGRRVIVVPMRLSGFGPYADVLTGLDYVAGAGLLPHPEVTGWILDRARSVICENGWNADEVRCSSIVAR